jgi:hypothetical protein
MLRFSEHVDFSTINWSDQASMTRRHAETLPPGARRNAAIDRALACEALAHSGDLLLQTSEIKFPGLDTV